MSKALEGEHLCLAHQGNHSHYANHNCTICNLQSTLKSQSAVVEAAKELSARASNLARLNLKEAIANLENPQDPKPKLSEILEPFQ